MFAVFTLSAILLYFLGPLGRTQSRLSRIAGPFAPAVLLAFGVFASVCPLVWRSIRGPELISLLVLTEQRLLWITPEATWSLARASVRQVQRTREGGLSWIILAVIGEWVEPSGGVTQSMSFTFSEDEEEVAATLERELLVK